MCKGETERFCRDYLMSLKSLPFVAQYLGSQVCPQLLLLYPCHAHVLPKVLRLDWHMSCWHGGSVCTFPSLSPGLSYQATPLSSYSVCTLWLLVSSAPLKFTGFFVFVFLPLTYDVSFRPAAPAMAAGVSILSDLPYPPSGLRMVEISAEMETGKRACNTETTPVKLIFLFYKEKTKNYTILIYLLCMLWM